MGIYRFMPQEYVASFLSGQVRFGRLRYYQLLEMVEQDKWIGDKNDGIAKTLIDVAEIPAGEAGREIRQKLEATGFATVSEHGGASFSGCSAIEHVECYVLSFSEGDFDERVKLMCNPEKLKYAYNGCIEILNMKDFMNSILDSGMVNGQSVGVLFKGYALESVVYEPNEQNFMQGKLRAHPFRKTEDYQDQAEFRIALFPKSDMNLHEDHIAVQFQPPDGAMQQKFLEIEIPAQEKVLQLLNKEDALVKIAECVKFFSFTGDFGKFLEKYPDPKEAQEQYSQHEEKKWRQFTPEIRQELILAYWSLRKIGEEYKDDRVDQVIIFESSSHHFIRAFREYLSRIQSAKI